MRDIVDRLRTDAGHLTISVLIQEREAAASEIERLRRTVERLTLASKVSSQPLQRETPKNVYPAAPMPTNPATLFRLVEVCKTLGVGRSTIYNWIAQGQFPAPLRVSHRSVRWRAMAFAEWLLVLLFSAED